MYSVAIHVPWTFCSRGWVSWIVRTVGRKGVKEDIGRLVFQETEGVEGGSMKGF